MNGKLFIVAGCLIAVFTAGWIANGWRMSSSYQAERAEVVQANADHFRDATKKVNDSANEYLRNTEQLERQIAELKKELADAKKNRPLPVDCKPDPDRLRVLAEAVHTANRAAAGQ